MARQLILTQEQLNEITGLMAGYFDGQSSLHGPNEVGTGEPCSDGSYGDPLDQTTDKVADTMTRRDNYMGFGVRSNSVGLQIYERTEDLDYRGGGFGGDCNKRTDLTKLKKAASLGNVAAQREFEYKGGDAALANIDAGIKAKEANVKNSKQAKKNAGLDTHPFIDRINNKGKGHRKTNSSPMGNGFITYNN